MVYLISLILLLLPTYLIRFSILGIPTTFLEILIYIVFLLGLGQAWKIGFKKLPVKVWLPIGLLIVALVISIAISPDKRTALGEFKGFFIDPILVFWLIWQFVRSGDVSKLFSGLIGSGLFVAFWTIVQKFLGQTTPDGRVIGIFGYSPNYLALFLVPIAVLLVAYVFQLAAQRKYWWSALAFLLLAIILLAIYFSGSRGGFLAIAGGLGVFLVISYWPWIRKRISAKIMIVILILASFYTSWTFLRPDFAVAPEAGRIATSNNVRWQIWQATIELGLKHPLLGVGLGNFQEAFGDLTKDRANFPEYITPLALTPHNIFLMFWLSVGILGLAAFIWLLVNFYRQTKEKMASNLGVIVLAVFSSIIIYGLVEASIWKNDLSLLFWTFWGLIWVI